jgi:hypothetical protein
VGFAGGMGGAGGGGRGEAVIEGDDWACVGTGTLRYHARLMGEKLRSPWRRAPTNAWAPGETNLWISFAVRHSSGRQSHGDRNLSPGNWGCGAAIPGGCRGGQFSVAGRRKRGAHSASKGVGAGAEEIHEEAAVLEAGLFALGKPGVADA